MFPLGMCTQTYGSHPFFHILNVNNVLMEFRCSNVAMGKTIGLYLLELQKIDGGGWYNVNYHDFYYKAGS